MSHYIIYLSIFIDLSQKKLYTIHHPPSIPCNNNTVHVTVIITTNFTSKKLKFDYQFNFQYAQLRDIFTIWICNLILLIYTLSYLIINKSVTNLIICHSTLINCPILINSLMCILFFRIFVNKKGRWMGKDLSSKHK